MSDHVPSVFDQGFRVKRIRSGGRTYNSGLLLRAKGESPLLCSRQWNAFTKRTELMWQRLEGDEAKPWKMVSIPGEQGWENYEDARVIEHDGEIYLAYTDADYRGKQFISRQGLALLDGDMDVVKTWRIGYGRNYQSGGGAASEKNWQFFSHEGRLHFVYQTEGEHVVVALGADMQPVKEWRTPGIVWPWGRASGGTPPVKVGNRYISFFHSFVSHGLRRRYFMAAYAFEAEAPFRIVSVTEPVLRASENDEMLPNPANPQWQPIVIFPITALRQGKGWQVCAGVNDSYDVLITVPDTELSWSPFGRWSKTQKPRTFETENASRPVRYDSQDRSPRPRWEPWKPEAMPQAGHLCGRITTTDCNLIESLETLTAAGVGVREVKK